MQWILFFEDQLEEHLEEHIEREEYIEPSEFQCVECNEFFSRDDAIKHENEGECDQCGKWLGCEKNVQTHKLKEHKIINKKENKDSHEPNIIRADKDKFINGTRTKEKDVIEMFKIVSENPDRDIETTHRQDQNNNKKDNKENQEIFTTQELENNKKDKKVIDSNIIVEKINCLNKISSIGKPLTNIIKYVEENPERDKNTTKKQDKIREYTTKEAPMDKNNAKQTFFEWSNQKKIKKYFK